MCGVKNLPTNVRKLVNFEHMIRELPETNRQMFTYSKLTSFLMFVGKLCTPYRHTVLLALAIMTKSML